MKRYDRRTFLKLSGASAVMLALAACDDSCSSGSTSSGSATETPPSPPIPRMLNQYRVGVDFDYEGKQRYSMDRLYPATEAQFQQLVDELIKDYGGVPGLHEDDPVVNKVGITVVDINDKTYWAAYIIDKWQGIGDG